MADRGKLHETATHVSAEEYRDALSRVASSVSVVTTDGPHGITDLIVATIAAGLHVHAVPHDAPWVDVNDASSRDRAEAMVRADPASFGDA